MQVRKHVAAGVAKGSDDLTLNYISASNKNGVKMTVDRGYDLTIGKNMLDDDHISVTCRYARVYDGSMPCDTNGVAPVPIFGTSAEINARMPLVWCQTITVKSVVAETD